MQTSRNRASATCTRRPLIFMPRDGTTCCSRRCTQTTHSPLHLPGLQVLCETLLQQGATLVLGTACWHFLAGCCHRKFLEHRHLATEVRLGQGGVSRKPCTCPPHMRKSGTTAPPRPLPPPPPPAPHCLSRLLLVAMFHALPCPCISFGQLRGTAYLVLEESAFEVSIFF